MARVACLDHGLRRPAVPTDAAGKILHHPGLGLRRIDRRAPLHLPLKPEHDPAQRQRPGDAQRQPAPPRAALKKLAEHPGRHGEHGQ